jgi:hypothetical protein
LRPKAPRSTAACRQLEDTEVPLPARDGSKRLTDSRRRRQPPHHRANACSTCERSCRTPWRAPPKTETSGSSHLGARRRPKATTPSTYAAAPRTPKDPVHGNADRCAQHTEARRIDGRAPSSIHHRSGGHRAGSRPRPPASKSTLLSPVRSTRSPSPKRGRRAPRRLARRARPDRSSRLLQAPHMRHALPKRGMSHRLADRLHSQANRSFELLTMSTLRRGRLS